MRRLGNLAILGSKENSEIGNDSFSEKKKVLKKSNFKTTSSVAKKKDWTAESIVERQEQLAELAVKTWPLSGAVRKPAKKAKKKKAASKKTTKKAKKKKAKRKAKK